ncbi:MAG: hypothetical protein RLZ85_1073, partial [Verrucomicrobiota bacterium]
GGLESGEEGGTRTRDRRLRRLLLWIQLSYPLMKVTV